jgi:hypothetical protein
MAFWNAWKKTWTREIGLVLWECLRRPTLALVEMDGRSCRELLEGRAHSRSLGLPNFLLRLVALASFMRFSLTENRTRGRVSEQRGRKFG